MSDISYIQMALVDMGLEPMAYGRSKCLAVIIDADVSVFSLIGDLVSGFEGDNDEMHYLGRDIARTKTESLGCDTVVYWPGLEYADEGEE